MTAKETWEKVCAVHQMKGTASVAMLKRQLWKDIVYRNGSSMQSHIDQFTAVSNKLADMGYPEADIDLACALLYSVPSDWKVRQSITEKTLPTNKVGLFQHVCNDFMQEERERQLNHGSTADSSIEAFLATLGQKICTFPACTKRVGHVESECFAKHPEKKKEWEAKRKPRAKGKGKAKQKALAAATQSDSDSEEEDERKNAFSAIVLDASVLERAASLSSTSWIVDSGASAHLCNSTEWFTSLSPCKRQRICVANKQTLTATHSGTVKFSVKAMDKYVTVSFSGVLFVPGIKVNLLSVPTMDKAGLTVTMGSGQCSVRNPRGVLIGSTALCGRTGLYRLDVQSTGGSTHFSSALSATHGDSSQFVAFANTQSSRPVSWAVLHARLGHLHAAGMKQLLSDKMADGLVVSSDNSEPDLSMCRGCIQGKSHRSSFPTSEHRTTRPLELVHSDVAGPFSENTFQGFRYFVTFIDDSTRYDAVYLMHGKDDVTE